jgi:hypothetical protein
MKMSDEMAYFYENAERFREKASTERHFHEPSQWKSVREKADLAPVF